MRELLDADLAGAMELIDAAGGSNNPTEVLGYIHRAMGRLQSAALHADLEAEAGRAFQPAMVSEGADG